MLLILFFNTKACPFVPAERLRDFNIALMSSPPNEVEPGPKVYDVIFNHKDALGAGESRTFVTNDTLSGRYLVIQLLGDSDPLTLCEVQVSGHQCGRFLRQLFRAG